MIITHKIATDLMRPGMPCCINAVQDDKYSRNLELSIFANSVAWPIPDGVDVLIRYCKSDNKGGEYNTMPDGTAAWHATDHLLTVALAPQVLTTPGPVAVTVTLCSGEWQISTFNIMLNVKPAAVADITDSEDYYNILTIGTVESLPAGSAPTATLSGTSKKPVLNLGIPTNDPGAISWDDIEGKPFGETETVTGEVILEEAEVTTSYEGMSQANYGGFSSYFSLTVGNTYIVNFDGVEYACIAVAGEGGYVGIGNPAVGVNAYGVAGDNPEAPFCIITLASAGVNYLYTETEGTRTVSIAQTGEKVTTKLAPDYIDMEALAAALPKETWTFELEDGRTVSKQVVVV